MKKIVIIVGAVVIAVIILFVGIRSNLFSSKTYTATTTSPVSSEQIHTQGQLGVQSSSSSHSSQLADLGTYQYACDEHVFFSMTPATDLKTIHLKPVGGKYPPDVVLTRVSSDTGVRYEGSGVIFTAHGETVVLGEGDSAINCSPVEFPESAPFNFGD